MALTTSTGVPGVIEIGNVYNFVENFSAYPATTFTLKFVYQIPGNSAAGPFSITATTDANGVSFDLTLNATGLVKGLYSYAEYATEIASGQRATAKTSVFQVIPDLSQPDTQSTAQLMLANVETAIKSLTLRPLISVSVNNVSYTRSDLATLIRMRIHLQAEVNRERQAADAFRGIETSGRIATRFRPLPAGTPFFSKDIGQ